MDDSILKDFVEESKDHLEVIEGGLLLIENDEADIHAIFRAIHSIKGASGFLGLPKLSSLSHTMENLLQTYRDDIDTVTPEGVDALLVGTDILKNMMADIHNSESIDIDEAKEHLDQALGIEKHESDPLTAETNGHDSLKALRAMGMPAETIKSLLTMEDFMYLLILSDTEAKQQLIDEVSTVGKVLFSGEKNSTDQYILISSVLDPDLIPVSISTEGITILPVSASHMKDLVENDTSKIEKKKKVVEKSKKSDPVLQKSKTPSAKSAGEDSIRIPVSLLDRLMGLAGELVLVRNQQIIQKDNANEQMTTLVQQLDLVTTDMQDAILKTRMQPIGIALTKVPRITRDLSKKLGKNIEVKISGQEVEIDKTLLEGISDPLTHMIRNSCDHGIEMPEDRVRLGKPNFGTVDISARHEGGQILIELKDDGKGIDPEIIGKIAINKGIITAEQLSEMPEKDIIQLIMAPGFSTAEVISDVSGRGVGMDVVRTSLEKLGGTLDIKSTVNQGTRMIIRLPLTLAIIQSLIVSCEDQIFAIPQINLEEVVCLYDKDVLDKIETLNGQEVFRLRDDLLPVVRLKEILKEKDIFTEVTKKGISEAYKHDQKALWKNKKEVKQSMYFAVLRTGNGAHYGLVIDSIVNTEEIVVKPLHPYLENVKIYSGATVLGDGNCALILDSDGVLKHTQANVSVPDRQNINSDIQKESSSALVFKWGPSELFAIFLPMIRNVVKVKTKDIEIVGMKRYVNIDGQSTLILDLSDFLKVSNGPDLGTADWFYFILPKHHRTPFGILCHHLEDIVQVSSTINEDSMNEDGFVGSEYIHDHLTLFLDIYRIFEMSTGKVIDHSHQQSGKKILYAEDTLMFRQIVSGYLREAGYIVETANDGAEALKKLKENRYDLLLSDLEMPIMGGLELVGNVRKDPSLRDLPAVAITTLNKKEDVDKGLKAGFDRYENKIHRESLLQAISGIFNENSAALA